MSEDPTSAVPGLRSLVQERRALLAKFRRDLHRIPETGFREQKTSRYVAEHLRTWNLRVEEVAGTGLLAILDTGRPGPTVMVRADMDALPVQEETGLPFASIHPGAMHACGHDGHMTMTLGTASVLSRERSHLRGTMKFLFQPAEEGPGGARHLIEAGVLEDPPVDFCLGCHLWPELPEGTVGVREGAVMAAMDRFDVTVRGRGGHGAMPHLCVDALEVGTQVVGALQRLVSRRVDPLQPAVLTVGEFHAGSAFNVIADHAVLAGTTRAFDRDLWESWPARLEEVARGVCGSMGAEVHLDYQRGYPPTVNDAGVAAVVRRCAAAVVGEERVVAPRPSMGSEDMSLYLERVPGCYFFLGVGREGSAPLHSSRFDFDEQVLEIGVEVLCRASSVLATTGVRESAPPPSQEPPGSGRE